MWWTHHLTQPARERIAERADFALPSLPADVVKGGGHEYAKQISCVDCHVGVQLPDAPKPEPGTLPPHTGPQYPVECPVDNATGKPTVWYDRTKRCDWDFEPFCSPCEGIGGLLWGNGEGEYNPMPCTPLMGPHEIPEANLTSVIWPKSFSVFETNSLTHPGTDPCEGVKFQNSTDMLYFDTREDGPHLVNYGVEGGTGPFPVPAQSWMLPSGNFYTRTEGFCVCLSITCETPPCPSNTVNGPLAYDWAKGALLVGRERIVPEYIEREMVADHWVKGPHHFWVEVATNLMVREWQPFNGHQIWQNWNLTKPDPSLVDVPKGCNSGLLHHNISCIAPPPNGAS